LDVRKFNCYTDDLTEAADIVKKGGIVIYPTDTLYGIGCNPYNEEAIKKVIHLKASFSDALTCLSAVFLDRHLDGGWRKHPAIASLLTCGVHEKIRKNCPDGNGRNVKTCYFGSAGFSCSYIERRNPYNFPTGVFSMRGIRRDVITMLTTITP